MSLKKLSGSGEHRDFFSGSEESQDSDCAAKDSIPEIVEQPPASQSMRILHFPEVKARRSIYKIILHFLLNVVVIWKNQMARVVLLLTRRMYANLR